MLASKLSNFNRQLLMGFRSKHKNQNWRIFLFALQLHIFDQMPECQQILGALSLAQRQTLQAMQVQGTCQFTVNKKFIFASQFSNTFDPNKGQENLCLKFQIRGEYLVNLNKDNQSICCGFKFREGISFRKLLFKQKIHNENLSQMEIQQIQILGLNLFKQDQSWLILYKINTVSLEDYNEFIKVLSKKYIRQKGFFGQYNPIQKIGRGISSHVFKVHKAGDKNQLYSIKVINKQQYFQKQMCRKNFQNQFLILTQVSHPNIIRFHCLYDSNTKIYLVTELLEFSLFDLLTRKKNLTLRTIRFILINLLKALEYLAQRKIMHRDIKLQNIMFRHEKVQAEQTFAEKDSGNTEYLVAESNKIVPVLIDFGLAAYSNQKIANKLCGTPGFIAPEITNFTCKKEDHHYTEACDMFAVGVLCYFLIFKQPLFSGQLKKIQQLNRRCQINFESKQFLKLKNHPNCLSFFKGTLQKNPQKRLSASSALKHAFLQKPQFNQEDERMVYQQIMSQFSSASN